MIIRKDESKKEHLYLEVYEHFKNLILEQKLSPGSKMPSLRKCAEELKMSRTTIESAYLQLAADGYILAKPQSGYYITEIAAHRHLLSSNPNKKEVHYRYDFASAGVDRESFRFDLWSRYIKSALRQDERMLTYGEAQGEADLRQVLSDYIRERRNIICSPDDIVVGASVQSLLQILCPLIHDFARRYLAPTDHADFPSDDFQKKKTVSFPTPAFIQGSTVFKDFGFEIQYRNKDSNVIYVSPAHMTKWGAIMSVNRRLELLNYADKHGSLIIEDDYENEFVYLQKPTPSLFGLSGGKNVVYIGSFSRLLLPSIRISFMILPDPLLELYREKAEFYNQTASKAEQIALCQFIRDGHLSAQTRKLKRLYLSKQKRLQEAVHQVFGENAQIQYGAAGTSLALTLPLPDNPSETSEYIKKQAQTKGLHLQILRKTKNSVTFLLSCSSMPVQDFVPACRLLKELWSEW